MKRIGSVALLALALCGAMVAGTTAEPAEPHPWVDLADGHLGDYTWTVKAKRAGGDAGAGPQGARRPCLSISTTRPVGAYSYSRSRYRSCVDPSAVLSVAEPLVITTGMRPGFGSSAEITAVGMAFAPAARVVRASFADGSRTSIHLDPLTPAQAHAGGLAPLRYAAFAVHGGWCAVRLVSYDAAGGRLWDSGADEAACGTQGAP